MANVVVYRRGSRMFHRQLDREPVRIGKSRRCELSLPDRSLARHQGAISWEDGRYRFDDRSGKKTQLNGEPVASAWLKDQDWLDLGLYRLQFRDVEVEDFTDDPSAVQTAEQTAVDPVGERAPLPDKLWLTAQRPSGGKAIRVELGQAPLEVGTRATSDLCLTDDSLLSGDHCRVARQGDALYVSDLGSTNGTWARGLRFEAVALPLGERFRAGQHDLWVSGSLAEAEAQAASFEGLYTEGDPGMLRMFERIVALAASQENVLIRGETGTGKDLVARALHRRSRRAQGPYLPINCGALSPQLLEATLFGSEKGAYTGADVRRIGLLAAVDGGTLFLDEIGDMPLELQVKLLRAVESGEILPVGATKPLHVDVRFVAGSHRDLPTLARLGHFREDLLYRLSVLRVEVPPLRQRIGDVPLLWNVLARAGSTHGMVPVLTPAVVALLKKHRWPGNVRELESTVSRSLCVMTSDVLRPEDIDIDPSEAPLPDLAEASAQSGLTLEEVKVLAIRAALQRNRGNRTKAAQELGIERTTIQRQIAEHGLEREGLRDEEEGE